MQSSQSILDLVNNQTKTIFYFTDSSLTRNIPGFKDLNYIFDGLISQVISESTMDINKHSQVFMTNSFNNQLCLIHFNAKSIQSSDLDEQIAFLTSMRSQENEILVLDATKLNWCEKLSKRYTQYKFYGHALI